MTNTRSMLAAAAALAGALYAGGASAILMVDGTVTPAGGGVFRYELTVNNDTLADLALITLDAPPGDPLIGPSLTPPAGFLASYDAGFGLLDLLEGFPPASFLAGSITGPFAFDSLAAIGDGFFTTATALSVFGDPIAGVVTLAPGQVAAVAEPPPWALALLALVPVLVPMLAGRRPVPRHPRGEPTMTSIRRFGAALAAGALAGMPMLAQGASHSDAPLIKQDPQANITDVYAFVGTRYDDANQKMLNVLVQTRPFSEPGDGVIYERFADDARYSIHLTDPFSGETRFRYDFRFSDVNPQTTPGLKNPDTILGYGLGTEVGPIQTIGDARQNYTQTYTVTRTDVSTGNVQSLGSALPTAPPNVGRNTTPAYNDPTTGRAVSGATTFSELDTYTQQAIQDLTDGAASFAGPREDGFYADVPGIFDLLDGRIIAGDTSNGLGQNGGGVDGFKGFNVLSFALQIPLDTIDSVPGFPFVGVYASVGRQRITLRTPDGAINAGPFVQVNRMGNPLFNEVLVALRDKDRYNLTSPTGDVSQFAQYALEPELASLINTVFGTSFVETGRDDLFNVYIPDVLRVFTDTGPVPLPGQTGFSRLSLFDGDVTDGFPSGFPNGRRIGDDVVDIALTAIASGPTFDQLLLLGDNVNANDQLYHQVFPYLGTPHAGASNSKDSPAP